MMQRASSDTAAIYDTFPKLLLRNAEKWPDRAAIREKDLGIWQSWSWSEVLAEVEPYSRGIKALGLRSGSKVAIIGDNRPRLYWTLVAAQSLGAIPVPIYQDAVAEEMVFVLEHAEISFAVVENQEQVDKILSIKDRLPRLQTIIYDRARGLRNYTMEGLFSFEEVQELGRNNKKFTALDWRASIAQRKGSDHSVMLYTSGTTGQPKGVVLSNNNVRLSAEAAIDFDNLNENDTILSYLPMAWVGDHVFSFAGSYVAGICIACPESAETMHHDLIEIGPTFFFAPPRIFETMLTDIMIRIEAASRFKQLLFHTFIDVAKRIGEKKLEARPCSPLDFLLYTIGDILIYGPLKNRLGFSNIRVGYTVGEAVGHEIFSFYRSLGINLKQLYGQTEATVFVTVQPNGNVRPDTVGFAAPGVDIKISASGEVLFKSPGVFVEYFKNDKATAETKTEDGWVFTGDAGFFERDGQLKIIDRVKDLGKLKDGSLFVPKYIENKLKFFPNIKEAVAIGHDRDFVTAMINIDLQAVGNWAECNNISYASYQELAGHPSVLTMLSEHVSVVNQQLSNEAELSGSQIKRFLILHKELDADDGELTRTLKVRRPLVFERYEELIEALYDGSKEKFITTLVTFEDGREGKISASVKINDAQYYGGIWQFGEAAE